MSKLIRVLPLVTLLVLWANAALAWRGWVGTDDVTDVVVCPAVPEPTAALVMGAGLVVIAASRRLRRQ